jgi:magnesium transporter
VARAGTLTRATGDITTTSVDESLAFMRNAECVSWLLLDPDEFAGISDRLGYERLSVDDAWHSVSTERDAHQRAQVIRFSDHTYFALYQSSLRPDGTLSLDPVSVFVSHQSLVVVASPAQLEADQLQARWKSNADVLTLGSLALLHAVLDSVVDSHLGTVDQLADAVDEMEDTLFDTPTAEDDPRTIQMKSYATRKALVQLRRVAQPMRELITSTMRHDDGDHPRVDPALLPYYQDLYDHVLRVNDTIEGLRDLITTIYETRLALFDHTLNTVTRQLAAWAAIIAVPTAVTGFYGQNVPYPGYLHAGGFITSTVVWLGGAVILYVLFRRKHWL